MGTCIDVHKVEVSQTPRPVVIYLCPTYSHPFSLIATSVSGERDKVTTFGGAGVV